MQSTRNTLVCCLIGIICILLPLGCGQDDDNTEQTSPIPATTTLIPVKPSITPKATDEEIVPVDFQGKFLVTPPEDDNWITFGAFRAPKPEHWQWIPPRSTHMTCNYLMSSPKEEDLGTFTIFLYEPGQSGVLIANTKRWEELFRTYNGAPVKSKVKQLTIGGKDATIVELRGEYMGANATYHLADQTLLFIIMKEETNTVFFKLLGSTATINAQRETLDLFLEAIEHLPPTT